MSQGGVMQLSHHDKSLVGEAKLTHLQKPSISVCWSLLSIWWSYDSLIFEMGLKLRHVIPDRTRSLSVYDAVSLSVLYRCAWNSRRSGEQCVHSWQRWEGTWLAEGCCESAGGKEGRRSKEPSRTIALCNKNIQQANWSDIQAVSESGKWAQVSSEVKPWWSSRVSSDVGYGLGLWGEESAMDTKLCSLRASLLSAGVEDHRRTLVPRAFRRRIWSLSLSSGNNPIIHLRIITFVCKPTCMTSWRIETLIIKRQDPDGEESSYSMSTVPIQCCLVSSRAQLYLGSP